MLPEHHRVHVGAANSKRISDFTAKADGIGIGTCSYNQVAVDDARENFDSQFNRIGLNDDKWGSAISPCEFLSKRRKDPQIGSGQCNAVDVLCGISGDSGPSQHHKDVSIELFWLIDEFDHWGSVSKRVPQISAKSMSFVFACATMMSHELKSSIGRQNFSIKKLYG